MHAVTGGGFLIIKLVIGCDEIVHIQLNYAVFRCEFIQMTSAVPGTSKKYSELICEAGSK